VVPALQQAPQQHFLSQPAVRNDKEGSRQVSWLKRNNHLWRFSHGLFGWLPADAAGRAASAARWGG